MGTDYEIRPVGYVRSAFKTREEAPRQGRQAGLVSEIELLAEYAQALEGLERRARLVIITWMDRADRGMLKIVPRGDPEGGPTGVFNTRSPNRPNPLGLCVVEILEVKGAVLTVRGLDALDGTPVVDIKPYVDSLDGP